jgi:hypothetical protein
MRSFISAIAIIDGFCCEIEERCHVLMSESEDSVPLGSAAGRELAAIAMKRAPEGDTSHSCLCFRRPGSRQRCVWFNLAAVSNKNNPHRSN